MEQDIIEETRLWLQALERRVEVIEEVLDTVEARLKKIRRFLLLYLFLRER